MRSGFMAGRMIGANFEDDTLTFEMDRGYYAAAGKYVILRDSDYADLNQQRAELLEAVRRVASEMMDYVDQDADPEFDTMALWAHSLAAAIGNATQQRKEPGA